MNFPLYVDTKVILITLRASSIKLSIKQVVSGKQVSLYEQSKES